MQQTERHAGKFKQKTNWSASTLQGKRKVFRFETVKFTTRAFEIKLIPILLNSLTPKQSLLILWSVFRVEFDVQFHRLCYKTIGSCF